jgi:hypothetical protein
MSFVLTGALRLGLRSPILRRNFHCPVHGVNAQMTQNLKKLDPQSGRVTHDERGQPVWEWRVDTGKFSRDVDTKQVRKLQEDASVKLGQEPAPRIEGFDPYDTATSAGVTQKPRRTLDDMRKLNEEIKRKREQK